MNLLWSYAYARRATIDTFLDNLPWSSFRFLADSGAHSARTLGLTLDTDLYGAWLKRWHPYFTAYANLDVIYGPRATWENQQRLEAQGLSPMPVFHTGEPWSYLAKYLEAGYTYIALGKLLGTPWPRLAPWLAQAFRMAEGTAVFHGFGMTHKQGVRDFPWYSVDSSSWAAPYRYGHLTLFDRNNGTWSDVRLRNRESVIANRRLLEDYGVDLSTLSRTGYHRSTVGRLSAAAYVMWGEWAAERHGPITLPPGKGYPRHELAPQLARAWDTDRFHVYLAEVNPLHHLMHAEALAHRSPA